jgi:hypothetical protein
LIEETQNFNRAHILLLIRTPIEAGPAPVFDPPPYSIAKDSCGSLKGYGMAANVSL